MLGHRAFRRRSKRPDRANSNPIQIDDRINSDDQAAMRNMLRRLVTKHFDYSTRHHMKARLRAIDIKFMAAIVALVVGIIVVLKFY
jgi:hypothetical protein